MTRRDRCDWLLFILAAMACLLGVTSPTLAQIELVEMRIDARHFGIAGAARYGSWTPLLLTLDNRSALPQQVRCEWIVPDMDGDLAQSSRTITLTPQRTQQVWLYACLPISSRTIPEFRVRVLDASTQRLIASQTLRPPSDLIPPETNMIATTGQTFMGLEPYQDDMFQQEKLRVVMGVRPGELPDKWHGLASLSALIWTPAGGDPGAANVSSDTHQAIRDWVRRGGHLVIILPTAGDSWSDSPLKDLLPPATIYPAESIEKPVWVGLAKNPAEEPGTLMARVLEPGPKSYVLLKDNRQKPLVIAAPVGLGRVTLVGLDLTDARLSSLGLPQGNLLWRTIFGWRNPVLSPKFIQEEMQANRIQSMSFRGQAMELGSFIPRMVAMRETAAGVLLASIIAFGVYWLLAGPMGYGFLQYRGMTRHAWLAFAVVVLVFTVATWGTALGSRPARSRISHFSVVDIDAASNQVHVQSWLSLFVPRHGRVDVAVDPSSPAFTTQTIASPGLQARDDATGFLDPTRYAMDSANPNRAEFPVRSTAKTFLVDYFGRTAGLVNSRSKAWDLPTGQVTLVNGWPQGELKHNLPGTLRDVLVVYCPGMQPFELTPAEPVVWRYKGDAWPAGKVLKIDDRPPDRPVPLATEPRPRTGDPNIDNANWWGGLLGEYMKAIKPGPDGAAEGSGDGSAPRQAQMIQQIEMLSFYSSLPPPQYTRNDPAPWNYQRTVGRGLDLTNMLPIKCIIVIGYLQDSPLPAPVAVDGTSVNATGWTAVRWVCPLQ